MTKNPETIKRYTSVTSTLDILKNKRLTLLSPEKWDDANDAYSMDRYRSQIGAGAIFALCATHTAETYHHWRIFAGGTDGVCLLIDRAKLEKKLRTLPNVRFGAVDYLWFSEIEPSKQARTADLPFLKRGAFYDEQEYRIVAQCARQRSTPYPIPIDLSWIVGIRLNPWMPKSLVDTLKAVFDNMGGGENLNVAQTRLTASPRWQKAVDRIATRNPLPKSKVGVTVETRFAGEYTPHLSKEATG